MNFDDYARQVTLKYQVAIATAVIKSKPNNLRIQEYINRLKNKIDNMDFDSDITVCSDDFKFDDDTEVMDDKTFNGDEDLNDSQATNVSVNILEGLNIDINLIDNKEVKSITTINIEDNEINYKINNEEQTQSTFCEDVQSQNLLEGNELILSNLNQHNTNNLENEHMNRKENNEVILNDNNTQSLPFDSQQTEIYYNNNEINRYITKGSTQYNTPVSSQINNTQLTKDINYKSDFNKNNLTIENTQMLFDSQETVLHSYQGFNTPKMQFGDTKNSNKQNLKNTYENNKSIENETFDSQQTITYSILGDIKYINNTKILNDSIPNNLITNSNTSDNQIFDTETQLNNAQEFLDTHISQSQSQFVEIKKNQLYKTKHYPNNKQKQVNNEKNETITPVYENEGVNKIIPNRETKEFYIQVNKTYDRQDHMKKDIEPNKIFNNDLEINNQIQEQEMDINFVDNIEFNSQLEIVPFKVIEELNRLKTYIEKKIKDTDGSLSDSGYKSDSQSRSSFSSHQQTQDTLVNHSARSLLDFILNNPLVIASKDIVIEISWVLGRLIDKLYIEEKYFLFLEEILSSIDNLLKDIYEGDYDDVILQKDNNINRLFLLNRSNHIIKYTIEKITNILEKYLSQLTNDLLELNTMETENLSYILHILECLLKRYIVNKNQNTQISNTQCTQEEKYLKKSNISDIWRRKWNSNYKTITNDSLVDTKCIEIKCMEVLNKIIVQSMEGYSLISFSALQCFNLLQT